MLTPASAATWTNVGFPVATPLTLADRATDDLAQRLLLKRFNPCALGRAPASIRLARHEANGEAVSTGGIYVCAVLDDAAVVVVGDAFRGQQCGSVSLLQQL